MRVGTNDAAVADRRLFADGDSGGTGDEVESGRAVQWLRCAATCVAPGTVDISAVAVTPIHALSA